MIRSTSILVPAIFGLVTSSWWNYCWSPPSSHPWSLVMRVMLKLLPCRAKSLIVAWSCDDCLRCRCWLPRSRCMTFHWIHLWSSQQMSSTPLLHLLSAACWWVDPPRNRLDGVQNKLVLSSRRQVASYAHHLEAPRISKSSPLGTFVQSSLDMKEFSMSVTTLTCLGYVPPSRNDTPFLVCLYRDAIQQSDFLQVRCVWIKPQWKRTTPSRRPEQESRDRLRHETTWCLYPFLFAQAQVDLFRSRIWSSAACSSRLPSSSPPCLWFHTCCSTRLHTYQPSLTNNRKLIGSVLDCFSSLWINTLNFMFFVIILLTSIDACLNEDVALSTLSGSIPASTRRIVNSVCTDHDLIWIRCPSRMLMSQKSFRWESRTLLENTARQELGSSLAACVWTGKSSLSVTLSYVLSGSSVIHSIGTSSQKTTLSSRSASRSSAGLPNPSGSRPWFLLWWSACPAHPSIHIICAWLRDIIAFAQPSIVNIALDFCSLSEFPTPTCSSHSLSSTCTCTMNRSLLALLLVQQHCERWNRAQWVIVSTPWSTDQKHFLLSVHQVTWNVTLRINFVVFCWPPPLAHDCTRTLRRSINVVRRHEVMLGQGAVVSLAAFVRTGGSCVAIVAHFCFHKPLGATCLLTLRDLVDFCGKRSLARWSCFCVSCWQHVPLITSWTLLVVRVHLGVRPYRWHTPAWRRTLRDANTPPVPLRTGGRIRNASSSHPAPLGHRGTRTSSVARMQQTARALCLGWPVFLLHSSQHKQRSKIVPSLGPRSTPLKKKNLGVRLVCAPIKRETEHTRKKKGKPLLCCVFRFPTLPTSSGEAISGARTKCKGITV